LIDRLFSRMEVMFEGLAYRCHVVDSGIPVYGACADREPANFPGQRAYDAICAGLSGSGGW
jgi:hypothetical protein